jgi:hypothetical protein
MNLKQEIKHRPSILRLERIKSGRRSQQSFASETGINVMYLGLIERCQLKATHDQVEKICKVLKMKPEQLFHGNGEARKIEYCAEHSEVRGNG